MTMTDLDALAVQVGRETLADIEEWPIASPPRDRIMAGNHDDSRLGRTAISGARAMLAKLRELGLVVEDEFRDGFVNELGNSIEIIIRGPTSESTNILTRMEAEHLSVALASKLPKGPGHE